MENYDFQNELHYRNFLSWQTEKAIKVGWNHVFGPDP